MKPVIHVGIDVGSTTVKVAALSPYLKLLFGRYQRHMSDIRSATLSLLKELQEKFSGYRITASISGSGGMGLAKLMGLPFCQEILAETKAVETFHPDTDVIIELGGEDEKITYLRNGVDQRMNGACAGGTGAFIDRMASLLSVDAAGLGQLAAKAGRIYPIASRCGVFAKTDIQALLNEGVSHEDIALSVFQSVVNQTISGLTCGRPVHGKVAFLGGPLTFQPMLREQFPRDDLYRVGGDEFVVFPAPAAEAEYEARMRAVSESLAAQGHSISYGIAVCEAANGLRELVREADEKMLGSKRAYYAEHDRRRPR